MESNEMSNLNLRKQQKEYLVDMDEPTKSTQIVDGKPVSKNRPSELGETARLRAACWLTFVMPALGRLKQEEYKFWDSWAYLAS